MTGHRPDLSKRPAPDAETTRAVVCDLLSAIRTSVDDVAGAHELLFAESEPGSGHRTARLVRILSALAPGPDQWVARAAVDLGYELQCVLPFSREASLEDVRAHPTTEESGDGAEYLSLIDAAAAIFELDGHVGRAADGARQPDPTSYLAAGRAILRQSDLLIALWDGGPAHGTGGTGQIVNEALAVGTPVIWVPWETPERWRLLRPSSGAGPGISGSERDTAELRRVVRDLLLPPTPAEPSPGETDLRHEYFEEAQPRGSLLLGCWDVFTALVCGGHKKSVRGFVGRFVRPFTVEPFVAAARAQAERAWTHKCGADAASDHPVPEALRNHVDRAFLTHGAWANGLALYYSRLHRGSFLVTSLLAAAAVFLALVTVAAGVSGHAQSPWIVAELAVILAIVVLTREGRRRHWHQRWIDYRILAERLRVASALSLLGGGAAPIRHAGHLARYGDPQETWMRWHTLAVERAAGLPGARADAEYLAACREFWRESLVENQRRYHEETAAVSATLERRLHRAGVALFVLTLAACALHLAHVWIEGWPLAERLPPRLSGWLTLLCAFLPAAGAACAAIRSQAEAVRVAQRSRAMREALTGIAAELDGLPVTGGAADFLALRRCADRVGELMIRETLDWRVMFRDRPLALPG